MDFNKIKIFLTDCDGVLTGILEKVKMSFCPRDAHREVKQRVQYIMNTNGGQGVIREIVDTFLGDKVE